MSQAYREALLPGTDALTAATVEWMPKGRGYLVRYRTRAGATFRKEAEDREEANAQFWDYVEKLRQEVASQR